MRASLRLGFVVLLLLPIASRAQSKPIVLVDVDHRSALSLNGDWHFIVDPYDRGLYTFHRELRKDGYF
jgi:beta-glucuronidase